VGTSTQIALAPWSAPAPVEYAVAVEQYLDEAPLGAGSRRAR
jgi:hypothetical protein